MEEINAILFQKNKVDRGLLKKKKLVKKIAPKPK